MKPDQNVNLCEFQKLWAAGDRHELRLRLDADGIAEKNDPMLPEQRTEPQERTRLFEIGLIPPLPTTRTPVHVFFSSVKK